jgi:hypothetical protein
MKKSLLFFVLIFATVFSSCSSDEVGESTNPPNGVKLEIVSVSIPFYRIDHLDVRIERDGAYLVNPLSKQLKNGDEIYIGYAVGGDVNESGDLIEGVSYIEWKFSNGNSQKIYAEIKSDGQLWIRDATIIYNE